MATAIEVLEHVPDPEATVAEMARVADRWLLVSVPREPLWRGLNVARGAYWRTLGNTPGHVNHWSKRSFVRLLLPARPGRAGALAVPVDDAARPSVSTGRAEGGYGRGAAVLSVGIAATGLTTYAYFALASHSLSESDYGGITLLWSAVFITVSVLYRPVEQLLSRTIAERDAHGRTGSEHLRVAASIQLALGALFAVAALALRGPLQDDLFGGSETLYWVLVASVLAYAVSYFARGFLAGSRRFGLYGGPGAHGGRLAPAVRAGGGRGDRLGTVRGGARASRPRRSCRWRWCRGRWARRRPAPGSRDARRSRAQPRAGGEPSSPSPTAPASPRPCWRSCSPSRPSSTPGRCW